MFTILGLILRMLVLKYNTNSFKKRILKMIIDFHTHAFPDKVAEKAIPKLSGIGGIEPCRDGTVSSLLAGMDAWHIDRAVILNIATNPKQQTNVNNFAIEINSTSERLYALGSINPDSDNIASEARRLADAGIRGIKIHPDYMGVTVDDGKFDAVYRECIDNDLFVVTHSGWDFISPDFIHCTPERICRVLEKFPALKLVAAHMGANKQWDDVERLLIGKNLWIETSLAPMFELDGSQCARMLKNHDPDKILFGSDCPWYRMDSEAAYVESLELSDALKRKLYYENALALLGELK